MERKEKEKEREKKNTTDTLKRKKITKLERYLRQLLYISSVSEREEKKEIIWVL